MTPPMIIARTIHQNVVIRFEMLMSIRVGNGSVPPRSSYIFLKIGTTNSNIPETIRTIRLSTTTG